MGPGLSIALAVICIPIKRFLICKTSLWDLPSHPALLNPSTVPELLGYGVPDGAISLEGRKGTLFHPQVIRVTWVEWGSAGLGAGGKSKTCEPLQERFA